MTSATPVVSPPTADHLRGDGARPARSFLSAAVAAFVLSRLAVLRAADAPVMSPDEPGAWSLAQWLSGAGAGFEMFHMPRYPLASGVVLAPLWWLPVDGVTRYRLGLAVAAALVLVAAWAVHASLRRLGAAPWPCALGAALVLLLPSTTFATSFTYAEPTVMCCWALLCWGLVQLRDRWSSGAVALTAVAAGAAPFVHGRLAAAPVIWLCFVGWSVLARRRWPRRDPVATEDPDELGPDLRRAVLAVALTLAVGVGGAVLTRLAGPALWSDPEPALKASPWSWALDPAAWATMARTLLGQLWYAVAASAGLAVAGVAAVLAEVRRGARPGHRRAATAFAALVVSNVAISTLVMGGFLHESGYSPAGQLMPPRFDHLVYGRYSDAAIVLLSALGVTWCWHRATRRAMSSVLVTSVVVLVAGAVSVQLLVEAHPDLLRSFPTPNMSGTSALLLARGAPSVATFTVAALVAVVLVGLAWLRDRRTFVVVLALWLAVGAVTGTVDAVRLQDAATPVDLAGRLGPPSDESASVVVATDAARAPGLVGNWLPGIYELSAAGWQVERGAGDSRSLAASPPSDAGALVLLDGIRPGPGWIPRMSDRGAVAWSRGR